MTPYTNRSWPERLEIMKALEACGSLMRSGHRGTGFTAAIGRDKYSSTIQAMSKFGFECADLYTFPLGTDTPADHLRHDSHGIPRSCWLIADFQIKE